MNHMQAVQDVDRHSQTKSGGRVRNMIRAGEEYLFRGIFDEGVRLRKAGASRDTIVTLDEYWKGFRIGKANSGPSFDLSTDKAIEALRFAYGTKGSSALPEVPVVNRTGSDNVGFHPGGIDRYWQVRVEIRGAKVYRTQFATNYHIFEPKFLAEVDLGGRSGFVELSELQLRRLKGGE